MKMGMVRMEWKFIVISGYFRSTYIERSSILSFNYKKLISTVTETKHFSRYSGNRMNSR